MAVKYNFIKNNKSGDKCIYYPKTSRCPIEESSLIVNYNGVNIKEMLDFFWEIQKNIEDIVNKRYEKGYMI